ncbi:FecR domain-containing protein [Treponema sp. R80B11-R83G3]
MGANKKPNGKFRFIDFLVTLLCLSGAAYSVNLFWTDLFQTLNGKNKTPIGSVTIKRNTVQRRMSDMVIWDRLVKESPVYSNDVIRVGDNSEASLHVGGNDIALNENTLLRLRYDKETGQFQIELTSGSIGLVTAAEGGNVALNIMGKKVEAKPGTALNAAATDNGMALQVSEGQAVIAEDNQNGGSVEREIDAGAAIAMDSGGSLRSAPSVFVTQPKPNALYRKSVGGPINVAFSWNRINLQPDETLRLEIAEDQSFSRNVRALDGLNDSARAALNAGLWSWRLTFNGDVLDSGRFTIADAKGVELLSPARNRQFFYEAEPPKLYYQWSQADGVSHYVLEVDATPEFRNPIIKKQTAAVSFSDSSLGEGIWYWRVTPVFSQTGENSDGVAAPRPSAFRIVKSGEPQTPQVLAQIEEQPLASALQFPSASQSVSASQPASVPTPAPEIKIVYVPAPAPEPKIVYVPAPATEPVSRLPSPQDRQPADGYSVGIDEAKKGNINFRWSAVPGANAYLFTIYQETGTARLQVAQMGPENRTSWTTEIKTLGRGTFVWKVEAVNVGKDNVIERRGDPAESRFVVDIPAVGPVKIIKGQEVKQ